MGKQRKNRSIAALRGSLQPWTEEEAQRVLAARESSGKSVAAFAHDAGLPSHRVYWWQKRFDMAPLGAAVREATATATPAFVPVTIRPRALPSADAPVTVVVPGGLTIAITALDSLSAAWVAALVRSLEESAS